MGNRRSAGRRLVVVAALVLLAVGPWLRPVAAGEVTVSGRAFAVSVTSLGAAVVAPTPGGVVGVGARSFAPVGASTLALGVKGVASVAGLRAATDGSPSATAGPAVTSSAAVDTISLAAGLINAAGLTSTCTAIGTAAQGSSVVSTLNVGTTVAPSAPAPNTPLVIPGVVTGVLNEQVAETGAGRSGITVRAAHLQILPSGPGSELLDIVVAESRCLVDGATSVTPSTDVPTTRRPPPTPTLSRATTPGLRATTTTRPAPTSSTTTSAAPMPTTRPGDDGGPAIRVAASRGRPAGVSGSQLTVAATGFEPCSDVAILFDDRRIGVGHPDGSGRISEDRLSVPGDAGDGGHVVVASCRAGGRALRAAAAFQVVEGSGVHRSAFVTSLAQPDQVGTTADSLFLSALGALAMLLAIAFPSQLFNSTLDENYDEVRGWFGYHRPHQDDSVRHQAVEFVGFVLLGGLLYGLLSPDLAFDRSSAALVLGLSVSLVVVSLGFRVPHMFYVHHRDGEWGRLRVLPGTAVVAVGCVVVSRLVGFQPGYLYGLIAGLAIRRRLATDTTGALTAVSAVSVFALSFAAWFARVPVTAAAAGENASIWLIALEACLAAISVLGIETVVICLIPLRFVEGSKLAAWSRTAWALVFGLAAFGFVHVLLRPDSGYVASNASRATVVILFVVFGLVSVGFWAYFRFRPARTPATTPA